MHDQAPHDPTSDDSTVMIRRQLAVVINGWLWSREHLEAEFGQVWDSLELTGEFEVLGFRSPFVVVRRRRDQRLGSLLFQHAPRFYFAFVPD